MAVLLASALVWEGTSNAKTVGKAVVIVQIVMLFGTLFHRTVNSCFFATTHFNSGDSYTSVSHDLEMDVASQMLTRKVDTDKNLKPYHAPL